MYGPAAEAGAEHRLLHAQGDAAGEATAGHAEIRSGEVRPPTPLRDGIGQEVLAERSGLSQGYLSQIESGSWTAVTEDALGRIASALGVGPWVILAQAAGLKLDDVERFSEDERIWLDAFRALDQEQRETILRVAAVMRRPSPRRRGG